MKLGFIGLGAMGKPMALNLNRCGDELIVHDIRKDSFPEFEKMGVKTTEKQDEIAKCDIIFLSLPSTEVVKQVLLGEKGISGRMKKGQIVCDLSTIHFTATKEIANVLEQKNIDFVDAPVSGAEERAIDGTLTVMCGGKMEVYDVLKPYLKWMGKNILFMGDHGCGQLTKTINNILYDINIAAIAEMLPMAVKLGLNPEKIGSVINSSSGRSYASESFIPRILKRNFDHGYPLTNAYKDLVSGAELAAQHGIPLPVMHAAATTYKMAMLKGLEHKDKGAMICVYEDLLGVKFEK
jgi:3-hydroxyisobutyrate dehydrogenase-like beta-hydroxyacid dehydrogenase